MTPDDRPEYVTCVSNPSAPGLSLCGRRLGFEFAFVDATHAATAVADGSRLTLCPDCGVT